jgi:hypothetical protein
MKISIDTKTTWPPHPADVKKPDILTSPSVQVVTAIMQFLFQVEAAMGTARDWVEVIQVRFSQCANGKNNNILFKAVFKDPDSGEKFEASWISRDEKLFDARQLRREENAACYYMLSRLKQRRKNLASSMTHYDGVIAAMPDREYND